ncbi:hypothetical protein BDQ12DRAFT_684675 [Crucibulum laeve]|uniref:Uncharacterized protein n=1 Tax=Crucibulum laeve TaxID=68775 RepID=A0A5C3LXA8_9AGAR|nr:hypothetical protein BDQ12DRAFT_684675 [Crucibulum laeve]
MRPLLRHPWRLHPLQQKLYSQQFMSPPKPTPAQLTSPQLQYTNVLLPSCPAHRSQEREEGAKGEQANKFAVSRYREGEERWEA